MQTRHSRGDTVRLYFDLVANGAGVTGQAPTIAIQRTADGKWFQSSDSTWQTTVVENGMIPLDTVNLPGRYYLDFDQLKDDLASSVAYIVKKTNTGTPAAQEYEDLVFEPLAFATKPGLCSVQGTIYDAQGAPLRNVLVEAVLEPVFKDASGRAVQSDQVVSTYTDSTGSFDLPLVRNATFRLEVNDVGYSRKVTIPDQAQVTFTDL